MPTLTSTATIATRRLLRSPLVDVLAGPHGIDRYLELIRPDLTLNDARAEVIEVRRQTARSVTLTLRTNAAWQGFRAGQFVSVGVEIDGVRRTRTYSPACSQHRPDTLELTVTAHPQGLVSRHLHEHLTPGATLHLGDAAGEFVLPENRPQRLALISGGSGITPVLSMLRTLTDEQHDGEILFIHFARTARDWLYRPEVEGLAARHPSLRTRYVATREGGGHIDPGSVRDFRTATAAVCGPPALIDATRKIWEGPVLAETFTPPAARAAPGAEGILRLLRSDMAVPLAGGTLLEQVEAAGLTPDYGCRMGICHTCTCRKATGPVRNIRTGQVSNENDEDIQLCVNVPAGDVALEI